MNNNSQLYALYVTFKMCFFFAQNNSGGSGGMGRRNTYVCSDRNNADRLSVVPNGKENRYRSSEVAPC